MTPYTLFAIGEIVVAILCLMLVHRSRMSGFWTTLTTILAGIVWTGACLKIGLDVFKSDVAFALFGVVFPFSSVSVVILMFLAAMLMVFRLLRGEKIL